MGAAVNGSSKLTYTTASQTGFVNYQNVNLVNLAANTGPSGPISASVIPSLSFTLPTAGANAGSLEDDGTLGNNISQIRETNATAKFTTVKYGNVPSLTILRGAATDAVTLSAQSDFTGALTIGAAGSGLAGVSVNTAQTLTSLTVNGSTPTTFNVGTGTAVTTSGAAGQSYTGPVTLSADTTLSAGASGPINFGSTINGAQALTLTTAGTTTFGGIVGGTTALTSVTTDAAGATAINTTGITTTGAQTYNDAVTLGANATLTSTGSGNIALASTVDGAQTLTVNTAGTTTFGGIVGGTR